MTEAEQLIEISLVNDRIPEISTSAVVEGEKEICATEVFTLTDTASYKHLIPGKKYVLEGVLMDKTTGSPLVINGKGVCAETVFIPDAPAGEAAVSFTFDSRFIKADTQLVVFERLLSDGTELAVHADLHDEDQTVTVKVPEIGTRAEAEGKKEIITAGRVTIKDTVIYKNLTPGKEYTIHGILMDKAAGTALMVNGNAVTTETVFTPQQPDGEAVVSFTFDASGLAGETNIVAFESLYRDGVEIAVHADNKAYLTERLKAEQNPRVQKIIKKDIDYLDAMQMEMATARQFLFIARFKTQKERQTFDAVDRIEKVISEQGFEVRRMHKADVKRFLALYFEASMNGEQMPDSDGEQFYEVDDEEEPAGTGKAPPVKAGKRTCPRHGGTALPDECDDRRGA